MGLVLASMWALARLKVQGREPPAWGSAHRKGQQDAMGTRRHLSNNKPGGQADRTQGASFRSPQPSAFTAVTDSEVFTEEHVTHTHSVLYFKKCPDCPKIAEVGD